MDQAAPIDEVLDRHRPDILAEPLHQHQVGGAWIRVLGNGVVVLLPGEGPRLGFAWLKTRTHGGQAVGAEETAFVGKATLHDAVFAEIGVMETE